MADLRVNEAVIIEISATLRAGDADPTAGNIDVAIRFFKVGHANHLKYWDGDSWKTGPVYVTSTQKDFHAHEVSLAATALVAGMERGIITVRAANVLAIGGEARFNVILADGPTYDEMVAAFLAQQGADGDTLETLSDQLDFVTVPAGQRQITIHVQDELGASLPLVEVSIYDEDNAYFWTRKRTDPDGNYPLNLDDAIYKLRMTKGLHGFNSPETMEVTQDETFIFVGTSFVAPTSPDPNKCMIFGVVRDAEDEILVGAAVAVYAVTPQVSGGIQRSKRIGDTTTNEAGEFAIAVAKLTRVRFLVPEGDINILRTVPDKLNQDLAEWEAD